MKVRKFDIKHAQFKDITAELKKGDALLMNHTQVIAARLIAYREQGAKVEVFLERITQGNSFLARLGNSRRVRQGEYLYVTAKVRVRVVSMQEDFACLESVDLSCDVLFSEHGQTPLPPYIKRACEKTDRSRYQTVYARHPGSVAAPTAGLHFDQRLLDALQDKGVTLIFLLLHVASGSYRTISSEQWEKGKLFEEFMHIDEQSCEAILRTRQRGGRLFAVGTTSLRAIESLGAELRPYQGYTGIFIRPGFEFHHIDALITNFHMPESSHLFLLSAFAGMREMSNAYTQAIAHRYRFGSYGDSSLWYRQSLL